MLSLQSVHVEQFLPQAGGQPLPAQAEQKPAEDAVSFLDLLHAEQHADDDGQKNVLRMSDEQPNQQSDEKRAEKADDTAVCEARPRDEKPRVSKKQDEDGQDAIPAGAETLLAAVTPERLAEIPVVPVVDDAAAAQAEKISDRETVGMKLTNFSWQYVQERELAETVAAGDEVIVPLTDENALALSPDGGLDEALAANVQELAAENQPAFMADAQPVVLKADDMAEIPADGAKKNKPETKNKPRIAVTDLRTERQAVAPETEKAVGKAQQKNGADFAFAQKDGASVQMTMDMVGAADAGKNITSANTQAAAAHGSNFQAMLANAVQENAPDFVKAGSIVLRDGNQGAINVILRPESLGNVKISLSLSDKVITGQITVQSQEAYNAFRDSIDTLRAAFAQSGFEAQGFDLSFAGGQQFAQSQQDWQNPEFAVRADKSYGDFVAGEVESDMADYAVSDYGVNIVA
ncbi:MAG: hypothetical protein HDR38_07830 [Treponema sp.]|nr:hypothetical protein [Treponema sp.]